MSESVVRAWGQNESGESGVPDSPLKFRVRIAVDFINAIRALAWIAYSAAWATGITLM